MAQKIKDLLTNIMASIIAYALIIVVLVILFTIAILLIRLLIYNVLFPLFDWSPLLGFVVTFIAPAFLLTLIAIKDLK